jgi:flagellar hook assembly protein FlgD
MGRKVRTLVNGVQKIGNYTVDWDGKNFKGEEVPSGIYFYRLQMGDITATKKLILIR